MEQRLLDKVAVITGAATGIGKSAAILFSLEGAKVVVMDIDEAGGRRTVDEIIGQGGEALFFKVDLINSIQVETVMKEVVKVCNSLDILYNNAGVNLFARLTDTSEEDWDRVMAVNVKGTFLCCKYAIPQMIKSGGGSIINTASAAAIVGLRNLAAYTASKGAVLQLTRNIALDYASENIRANALCPGVTATEMTMKVIDASPDPRAAKARFDSARPMGRLAEPIEIARAALFLASDESSYMTGSYLTVDGGYTAE